MRRPDVGGDAIDRSRVVSFTFDGRELTGFEGDTLASALLANGIDVVSRSPIQGRPRGVYSAGVEEPCAFVGVDAPFADPVVAATTVDLVDGLVAHGVPGVGQLPVEGVATVRSEHRHAHVETLVVGASAEGVTEANAAAARVIADAGRVARLAARGGLARRRRARTRDRPRGLRATATCLIHQRSRPVERVWHVRARDVVLATGAHERPIAFADNDRPGVMLATSARTFLDRFGVVPGGRTVVFTTNHRGHDAAFALADAGVEIAAIVDVGTAGGPATDAARARGIDVRGGWASRAPRATRDVSAVHLVGPAGERDTIDADLLLVSGGWNPVAPALARDRRRSPLRRAARVLRPGRDRTALALRGRRRRRRRPDVRAVCGTCRPTTTRVTTWTCSATKPSPTCWTPWGTASARSSTSSARRTSGRHRTRAGRRAC